jgi:hypothetical protein
MTARAIRRVVHTAKRLITRRRKPRIRVANCPLHGPSWSAKVGRRALGLGAGVVHFTEAYKAIAWLRRRPLWKVYTGADGRVDARRRVVGHDDAIVVRRWIRVVEHGSKRAAAQIGRTAAAIKYHPERWLVWVVLKRRGRHILVIGLHPQPGNGHVALAEWTKHMKLAEELRADMLEKYGEDLHVVELGDIQHAGARPAAAFKRQGLVAEADGIIYMAHSPNLHELAHHGIPARALPAGNDHGWSYDDYEVA